MDDYYDVCGINKFIERDIDMLLAEELRVNAEFCRWVMGKFEGLTDISFPAAHTNVSVVEDGSEADVIATFFRKSDLPHRLFIENKIDAILMPDQLQRYVQRAEGEVRRSITSSYSILFLTPSDYFCASVPSEVKQITFEEVAQALGTLGDLRSRYRASLFMRALPLRTPASRDAHVAATDPYIRDWWDKVYVMLEREFPGFFLHKTRYPRSVYFAPETSGQGRYLRVDFKGHKGEVDLAFKNIPVSLLKEQVSEMSDNPGQIVPNGKSSAIQICGLDAFVISDGFGVIDTKVRVAYKAAHDLLVFWQRNQSRFDNMASSVTS